MSKFGLLIITYQNDDREDKMKLRARRQFVEATSFKHANALRDALEFSDKPLTGNDFINEEYYVAYRHNLRGGGTALFTLPELKDLIADYEDAVTTPAKPVRAPAAFKAAI